MEPHYLHLILALNACTMLPASWDKRFIRSLGVFVIDDSLSERQIEQLERMAFRYRKQLVWHMSAYDLQKVLEPYYERRRQEPTPEHIKNHWVKP
jgi:hypothetical protein